MTQNFEIVLIIETKYNKSLMILLHDVMQWLVNCSMKLNCTSWSQSCKFLQRLADRFRFNFGFVLIQLLSIFNSSGLKQGSVSAKGHSKLEKKDLSEFANFQYLQLKEIGELKVCSANSNNAKINITRYIPCLVVFFNLGDMDGGIIEVINI